MEVLVIADEDYGRMLEHCREQHPQEGCGLLGGRIVERGGKKERRVSRVYPMRNTRDSSREYFMEPEEQFRVFADLRQKGLELLSIFHSHPHTPPRPSQKDIEMAHYPEALYTIVSLTGEKPRTRVYSIRDGAYTACELKITERESDPKS